MHTDSNASFTVDEEHLDPSITEVYMGDWKRDKRDGYGISERSDGLKYVKCCLAEQITSKLTRFLHGIGRYEGEWHSNKKHGYGVTTFRDGTKEEGKYKCNVLVTSQKKKHLFLIRSAKFRERIDAAVSSAQRASKYALQKADIAVSRMATARSKGESADSVSELARVDSEIAVATAREFAPDFKPSVLDRFERIRARGNHQYRSPGLEPLATHLHGAKSPPSGMNMTPNHMPMAQASSDSTPQKQISFPPATQRRTSLQKQVSVDYPSIGAGTGPSPQNQFPTSSLGPAQMGAAGQYPHPAYPGQSQYNGGIQSGGGGGGYGPGQQYPANAAAAHQQFNNSNYMSSGAASAAQYGHVPYGGQQPSQVQTQYSQQSAYGANPAAYANYNNLANHGDGASYAQEAEYARLKPAYGPPNPGNVPTGHMLQQPTDANVQIIVTGIQGNYNQPPPQQMQNSAGS